MRVLKNTSNNVNKQICNIFSEFEPFYSTYLLHKVQLQTLAGGMLGKWLFVLTVSLVCYQAYAINFEVKASREECLYETYSKGQQVYLVFQVIEGGNKDIDVTVLAPDKIAIYSSKKETEGKFRFTTRISGSYAFCFSNLMSSITSKRISFTIDTDNGGMIL